MMLSRKIFCVKRLFLVVGIVLILMNFHIVINNPKSLQNILDNGISIKLLSIPNKIDPESFESKTEKLEMNDIGIINPNTYFSY